MCTWVHSGPVIPISGSDTALHTLKTDGLYVRVFFPLHARAMRREGNESGEYIGPHCACNACLSLRPLAMHGVVDGRRRGRRGQRRPGLDSSASEAPAPTTPQRAVIYVPRLKKSSARNSARANSRTLLLCVRVCVFFSLCPINVARLSIARVRRFGRPI